MTNNNSQKANFGFAGLGVMGRMLALNMQRHGFRVAGYDVDPEKVRAFGANPDAHSDLPPLIACATVEEFLEVLERPRRIMLMIPAGKPVDAAIQSFKAVLEPGDLLIDGGNTYFMDTERRSAELEAQGIIYIGTGVSGGEQGALLGPAIMPGGPPQAWELVKPFSKPSLPE
jgi:6-phosphogluconate dehydrogenase